MARYFGRVCEKHPELNGERNSYTRCIQCYRDTQNRYSRKLVPDPLGSGEMIKLGAAHLRKLVEDPNGSGNLIRYGTARTREHRQYQLQTPEGRAKHVAENRKYELSKVQRIPPWVTDYELSLMRRFYQLANHLGLTVDHIVPLRGHNVSGFHCFANLDMLTHSENASKSNSFVIE